MKLNDYQELAKELIKFNVLTVVISGFPDDDLLNDLGVNPELKYQNPTPMMNVGGITFYFSPIQ